MKSEVKARSARAFAQARDQVEILLPRMPAVHRRQHAVGTGLHRQMHVRHQRRQIAMRGDQVVVHVARMAGHVAQAHDAGHVAETAQQFAERRRTPVGALPVIGVHVLPDQRHLAHARVGQALDLGHDLLDRARDLGAARIGHDAKRAELVAAFLHGDEGGNAALGGSPRARGAASASNLSSTGKFGIDDLLARLHAREQDRAAGDSSASRPRDRRCRRGGRSPRLRPAPRSRRPRSPCGGLGRPPPLSCTRMRPISE